MSLRWHPLHIENGAILPGRLSLHRLPAKLRRSLRDLGLGSPQRFGTGGREPRKVAHAGRIRSFAACCGTHLFFEESADSGTIDITIASLDDPAAFAPQKVIWLEDRLPWVVIDQSLPAFPKSSAEREAKKNKAKKLKG